MSRLRFVTSGESHGPRLTAIVEGVPAGLPLLAEDVDVDLAPQSLPPLVLEILAIRS